MEFKIENQEKKLDAEILKISSNSEYLLKIQGKERNLKILNMTTEGIEFMLDNTYHFTKYLENTTAKMTLVVDGVKVTFDKHSGLDKIVYKNRRWGKCVIGGGYRFIPITSMLSIIAEDYDNSVTNQSFFVK